MKTKPSLKGFLSKHSKVARFVSRVSGVNTFSSGEYWDSRYVSGGNSGLGSYGDLAKFKADFLNKFVKDNKVKDVLEFGCGDGNQLTMFKFPKYIGLDVSKKSIEVCNDMFKDDETNSFFLYSPYHFFDNLGVFNVDLTLSLDVIYHLIEDSVFEKYMYDLFSKSKRFVIIYSSNTDVQLEKGVVHVKHREFTEWVDRNISEWSLKKKVKNKYPYNKETGAGSFADFYVYEKSK